MNVEIEVKSSMDCPYRCILHNECNHPDAVMPCIAEDKTGFPTRCPVITLRIKQTNDSIKFIEW